MNLIKLNCYHIYSDYTSFYDKEINLDKYDSFELDFRDDAWHISGFYQCNDRRISEEISDHGVLDIKSLSNFIKEAGSKIKTYSTNVYNDKNFNLIFEIDKLLNCLKNNE
jgi:hypothetical protein